MAQISKGRYNFFAEKKKYEVGMVEIKIIKK